jgi:phage gp29-like protein
MSKTPRMDAAFKELTSTTPRMNWQLDQCYQEGCKLERELAAVIEERDDAIVEATNAVNDIIGVRWKLKQAEETAERYRLDANRLEAEAMMLKEKLKEYDDTLTFCTDNFSCKTFVPQKWEMPPYDEEGKGTLIE